MAPLANFLPSILDALLATRTPCWRRATRKMTPNRTATQVIEIPASFAVKSKKFTLDFCQRLTKYVVRETQDSAWLRGHRVSLPGVFCVKNLFRIPVLSYRGRENVSDDKYSRLLVCKGVKSFRCFPRWLCCGCGKTVWVHLGTR